MIRTRYKIGRVLINSGLDQDEGEEFLRLARERRETLTGVPPDVDDTIESYDSLVPYWAW